MECTPFVREHVVEVCREECAETTIGGEDFRACVEACVQELRRRCSQV
ncbi:MAG: hypothetical protein ACP5FT_03810 [Acidilobus sp.]